MFLFTFVALYLVCWALLLAVLWQDRRRRTSDPSATAQDPRATAVPKLVFRTHA